MQAWLAARRNTIVAPVSGYVARRSVQLGARINQGTPPLSIAPLDQLWADANFKEPELRDIWVGQDASIEADIYGSKVLYHGKVLCLSAGTGSAFSLLPGQNASGNWIKVGAAPAGAHQRRSARAGSPSAAAIVARNLAN